MPIRKGLFKLYDAKRMMIQAIRDRVAEKSPEGELWIGVIDQAVFDAHLHSTGGKYPSIAYVAEARGYFDSPEFDRVCKLLNIETDWVRSMAAALGQVAKTMRGKEYDAAVIPSAGEKETRNYERRRSGRVDRDAKAGKGNG